MKKKDNDTNVANYLIGSVVLFSIAGIVVPRIINYVAPFIEKLTTTEDSLFEKEDEWEPNIVKNK